MRTLIRKTKQTLAFEQLEAEMEVINKETQLQFKGGVTGNYGAYVTSSGFNWLSFFTDNPQGTYHFDLATGEYTDTYTTNNGVIISGRILTTSSGDPYYQISLDNGQTWTNEAYNLSQATISFYGYKKEEFYGGIQETLTLNVMDSQKLIAGIKKQNDSVASLAGYIGNIPSLGGTTLEAFGLWLQGQAWDGTMETISSSGASLSGVIVTKTTQFVPNSGDGFNNMSVTYEITDTYGNRLDLITGGH